MNDAYEMSVVEYESARNEAMDKWFAARPCIERNTESEKLYEGGFRMAWDSSRSPGCSTADIDNKGRCKTTLRLIGEVLSGHASGSMNNYDGIQANMILIYDAVAKATSR